MRLDHQVGAARSRQQGASIPTSQSTNTPCFANLDWRSVVILSPTSGRGGSPFGFVYLTDTTHSARTIRRGHKKSIMSRWDYIKAEVSKFSGYMVEMIRSNPSDMSDSDKSVAAAADFAGIKKHNFSLVHCWRILKGELKWMELKRRMDKPQSNYVPQSNSARDATPHDSNSNTMDHDPDVSSPGSSTRKRPMGRDAAKADKKKASSASYEYVSKMHELSVQKVSLFKETEAERKVRLDEMVSVEKVKEHCRTMVELERERLAMDKQRLHMEAEKKEKEEDERILAINLDVNPINACTIKLCRKISSRS